MSLTSLPGHELVLKGLDDLASGVESDDALLVSIGAPRLRRAGIDVPQALASPQHRLYDRTKLERGHAHDLEDVAAMQRLGLVEPGRLRELFAEIEPELYRFPAIDPPAFRAADEAATR